MKKILVTALEIFVRVWFLLVIIVCGIVLVPFAILALFLEVMKER
jgi:hypothetical protein